MLKYILISFLIITNAYAYTCEEMGYTQNVWYIKLDTGVVGHGSTKASVYYTRCMTTF